MDADKKISSWESILKYIEVPDEFIQVSSSGESLSFLKDFKECYDNLRQCLPSASVGEKSALPNLHVDGFDEESIWQQVDLHNRDRLRIVRQALKCVGYAGTVQGDDDDLSYSDDDEKYASDLEVKEDVDMSTSLAEYFNVRNEEYSADEELENNDDEKDKIDEEEDDDEVDEEEEMDEEERDDDEQIDDEEIDDEELDETDVDEEDEDEEEIKKYNDTKSTKADKFFNRDEMENFLNKMDENERKAESSNEELDEYEEMDEDKEGGKHYHYSEFFDPIPPDESKQEKKSSFQKRQERMRKTISELEEQNLKEKSWQMGGEIMAKARPENSLLSENLLFDRATKLPPIITAESSMNLEEMIKRRIRDGAWDDPVRKVKPITEPAAYKNKLILDQQKSKQSLSEIYEQEYLKKTQKLEEEQKNPAHEEIRKGLKDLFFKLDALTNFHYTPKAPVPELKVVDNMPSVMMEEVAPIAVADSTLLAPEEVKEKAVHLPMAPEEMTRTDRNRARRKLKHLKRLRAKHQANNNAKQMVPKDKMKLLQKVGTVRTAKTFDNEKRTTKSAAFFERMNREVKRLIQNELGEDVKSKKKKLSKAALMK
ncbi:U3 small nucleolar ribonucleoprotein MPP10 [Trichinella zimbabwensis]|uniref:U3 small nucleolar ribonucleoprotein protein MPP10 n=1 Tax=Trichinella zimbabwensis TaxID=268475 RepID=A0A0V1I4B7_9BILA|nr:U3 small nucleolar ribonucleoprotein MPP10 [Trichinella zimbabwensis]KRZ17641.1 U3 small nucleolar ribonucleoprotein MPP10 [Trichinella zimbabwensis]KRZ17643.1 U3 small nucleolar ribonucleoprotein MPP10 [Trichinella zimbabwensis]KRZ17644.1 U3 small nucleolar ribonucleoprotein MPP10 [Trichinella zimbabwensis]